MKPYIEDEFHFYYGLAKAAIKLCREDELEIGDAVHIICQLNTGSEEEAKIFEDIIFEYYGNNLYRACK